jgi:diadenosine tetraphosphatase ApaH/serine/threonine PP2A family protein phosphatase
MDAIISDVHGNLTALEAVLEDIEKRNVKRIISLGDVVGYGPRPAECLRLIMKRCAFTLLGNHEYAVLRGPEGFNPIAAEAVAWTRKQLTSPELIKFLGTLKAARLENEVLFVHGSAEDPLMEYVREAEDRDDFVRFVDDLTRNFQRFDICFTGHNHRAFLGTPDAFIFPHEVVRRFNVKGRKLYICVGSAGQPRDDDPRASYATFDGEFVEFFRVPYDVEKTAQQIREAGLHPFLAERLHLGQ